MERIAPIRIKIVPKINPFIIIAYGKEIVPAPKVVAIKVNTEA
jgi:hypothetical protein